MKLLRFGPPGSERPGRLDKEGRVRDLSAHVSGITGQPSHPTASPNLPRSIR